MIQKFAVPHTYNDRFIHPTGNHAESLIWHTLPLALRIFFSRLKLPAHNAREWLAHEMPRERSHELVITWIGHSTFLIQCAGMNIITDPVLGNIAPIFRRVLPAGIARTLLPPIDYVIISHNHRDHMDAPSLRFLKEQNPTIKILVPQGDKAWFDARGFEHTYECTWWQMVPFANIQFTFLPAVHWSRRGLFDKNKSLWGSWMIHLNGQNIYFAGDTAYDTHFLEIANAYEVHVALMPIGPCEPDAFMRRTHVDAHQAVQAFHDLKAHHFVPMHWGTFSFGSDRFTEPVERLHTAWNTHPNLQHMHALHIVKAGQRLAPVRATHLAVDAHRALQTSQIVR